MNHFYCSLTLASPLCASETFSFQQMGKTDITINLTFLLKKRASDAIHHICFIDRCVCMCAKVSVGLKDQHVFVCIYARICVKVCVVEQMVFRPLCAVEKSPYVALREKYRYGGR